jgi:hypothetical protein
MALVLPLVFVFIMVAIDLGWALDRREFAQHGVREGARAAAVGKGIGEVIDATGFDPGSVELCYLDTDGNGTVGNAGDSVRVSGTYVHHYIIGSGWLPIPDVTMTPSSEARLETSVTSAAECP